MNRFDSPTDDPRISAYIDGELSADERQEFESILASRQDYRELIAELRSLGDSMRGLAPVGSPRDLSHQVLSSIEHASAGSTRMSPRQVASTHASNPSGTPTGTRSTSRADRWRWPLAALAASILLFLLSPSSDSLRTPGAGRAEVASTAAPSDEASDVMDNAIELDSGDVVLDRLEEIEKPERNAVAANAANESPAMPAPAAAAPAPAAEVGADAFGAVDEVATATSPSATTDASSYQSELSQLAQLNKVTCRDAEIPVLQCAPPQSDVGQQQIGYFARRGFDWANNVANEANVVAANQPTRTAERTSREWDSTKPNGPGNEQLVGQAFLVAGTRGEVELLVADLIDQSAGGRKRQSRFADSANRVGRDPYRTRKQLGELTTQYLGEIRFPSGTFASPYAVAVSAKSKIIRRKLLNDGLAPEDVLAEQIVSQLARAKVMPFFTSIQSKTGLQADQNRLSQKLEAASKKQSTAPQPAIANTMPAEEQADAGDDDEESPLRLADTETAEFAKLAKGDEEPAASEYPMPAVEQFVVIIPDVDSETLFRDPNPIGRKSRAQNSTAVP